MSCSPPRNLNLLESRNLCFQIQRAISRSGAFFPQRRQLLSPRVFGGLTSYMLVRTYTAAHGRGGRLLIGGPNERRRSFPQIPDNFLFITNMCTHVFGPGLESERARSRTDKNARARFSSEIRKRAPLMIVFLAQDTFAAKGNNAACSSAYVCQQKREAKSLRAKNANEAGFCYCERVFAFSRGTAAAAVPPLSLSRAHRAVVIFCSPSRHAPL